MSCRYRKLAKFPFPLMPTASLRVVGHECHTPLLFENVALRNRGEHTHMALQAKLENPQKTHSPKKGTAAKVTHKQQRKKKRKKKGHPRNRNPYVFPGLQNRLARKGQVEGMPSLRSQEGLATPGARLQPILNRKEKEKEKKEKPQWGDRPLAEGMASKAVSYWKRTSGVPKSPSSLVTTHDRRNLRRGLFVKFRVSRSK